MRRRLVLVALATTSLVVVAFVLPLAVVVSTLAAERAQRTAEVAAQSLAPALALTTDPATVEAFVENARQRVEGPLTVFLPDGRTLGDPGEPDPDVEEARQGRAFTVDVPEGREVHVPVVLPAGGVAVIRTLVPAEVVGRGVMQAWLGLAGIAVALIVGAVLVADRLGRSTVASVRELESVAGRVADGDLDARADPSDLPEVDRVADALHLLAGRVDQLLAEEREAAADLAHRLRTPLTALRLDADGLADAGAAGAEAAERILAGVDDVARVADGIIRDARRPVREGVATRTDLTAVVADRAAFWDALAEEQGRDLDLQVPPGPVQVPLPRLDVEALVDALLGNVIAHTPDGGRFRVRVQAADADGDRFLVVEDSGPGIPPHALLRGVSGGRSTGLGLDIVRRTARLTGGDVRLERSRDLGGALVEVRFGPERLAPT